MRQRLEFLHDPLAGGAQSIAAFALAARLDLLHRRAARAPARAAAVLQDRGLDPARADDGCDDLPRVALRVDDIGGLAIGAMAVVLARALTGFELGPVRTAGDAADAQPRHDVTEPPAAVATRRGIVAGPLVALVTLVAALILTDSVGLPLRDPDHVAALYLVLVGLGVAGLVGLDIVLPRPRAVAALPALAGGDGAGAPRALDAEALPGRRQRAGRLLRHLHGVPEPEGDRPAGAARRALRPAARRPGPHAVRAGTDPAILLHRLLGEGIPTHILSTAYVAFIVFLPLTIGLALVFSRELRPALFTRRRSRSTGSSAPPATSCCRRSAPSTPIPAPSPASPTPRSRACRACCWTSGSPSSPTRRPRRRRASRRSPRCTSR